MKDNIVETLNNVVEEAKKSMDSISELKSNNGESYDKIRNYVYSYIFASGNAESVRKYVTRIADICVEVADLQGYVNKTTNRICSELNEICSEMHQDMTAIQCALTEKQKINESN